MIERIEPMKIHGSVPTRLIRNAYRDHGPSEALVMGHTVLEGASDEDIMLIAEGRAYLDGTTPNIQFVVIAEESGGKSTPS